ncbi:MAG: MFS transporter [Rhodopseudomonas palustris]|nr:MFS transporter [Rhodopseudomonas palustris]
MALGLVVSIVGFAGLLFGTTAGLLVQRLGYRRVLVTALAAGVVLSALQALLPPLPVMLALRALEGVAHLAIVVAAPVLIAQTAPPGRQGLAMTLWPSFSPSPSPSRPGSDGRWSTRLRHPAAVPDPCALHGRLRRPAGAAAAAGPGRGGAVPPDDAAAAAWRDLPLAATRRPRRSGFFCYTLVYVALLTLLPPLTGHPGFLASAMPLTSIAVSMTLGVWLLGRVPAVATVQAGFAAAILAAGLLAAVWSHEAAVVAAALLLAGALGLVQGASFAAIPQLNPDREGRQPRRGGRGAAGQSGHHQRHAAAGGAAWPGRACRA